MGMLGSHEWNFEGCKSASYVDVSVNFSGAFRISAGVSGNVPQALRNLACRTELLVSAINFVGVIEFKINIEGSIERDQHSGRG